MTDIQFIAEGITLPSFDTERSCSWLISTIESQGKSLGELAIIFCSDSYLLQLNMEHLNHNTYTDIITFDYVEGDIISGDLFISVDRVLDNAKSFDCPFDEELHRVMVHGVLHLLGYGDKTDDEKEKMRQLESIFLKLRS